MTGTVAVATIEWVSMVCGREGRGGWCTGSPYAAEAWKGGVFLGWVGVDYAFAARIVGENVAFAWREGGDGGG